MTGNLVTSTDPLPICSITCKPEIIYGKLLILKNVPPTSENAEAMTFLFDGTCKIGIHL